MFQDHPSTKNISAKILNQFFPSHTNKTLSLYLDITKLEHTTRMLAREYAREKTGY